MKIALDIDRAASCVERILAIDNIFRSDVDQLNFLEAQKVERHLNILQHVEAHLAFLSRLKVNKTIRSSFESIKMMKLTKCSPESTSSSDSKLCPSRKSSNKSSTRREA